MITQAQHVKATQNDHTRTTCKRNIQTDKNKIKHVYTKVSTSILTKKKYVNNSNNLTRNNRRGASSCQLPKNMH